MLFAALSGRLPFGPLTVPTQVGIFPTDFSSHMSSADFPLAIADVAADPLRAVAFVRVPLAGLVRRSRQPIHAEALMSRCASFPASFSQSHRLSRGTPDCFQYVTVKSTEWAAVPTFAGTDNWGCRVCCLLTPHPSTPILTDGASVRPSTLCVRPISLRSASFNPPLRNESLRRATLHAIYHRAGLAH